MSIQGISRKFKSFFQDTQILLALLIIAVSIASFSLGRLSVAPLQAPRSQNAATVEAKQDALPIKEIVSPKTEKSGGKAEESPVAIAPEGGYVASKNGTKYHLPWCGGAKQIKEENKVYFKTKDEAEKAGYLPASNCKGI